MCAYKIKAHADTDTETCLQVYMHACVLTYIPMLLPLCVHTQTHTVHAHILSVHTCTFVVTVMMYKYA